LLALSAVTAAKAQGCWLLGVLCRVFFVCALDFDFSVAPAEPPASLSPPPRRVRLNRAGCAKLRHQNRQNDGDAYGAYEAKSDAVRHAERFYVVLGHSQSPFLFGFVWSFPVDWVPNRTLDKSKENPAVPTWTKIHVRPGSILLGQEGAAGGAQGHENPAKRTIGQSTAIQFATVGRASGYDPN
jgi:hypothetical protein